MAARILQKRIASLLSPKQPSLSQVLKEQSVPSVSSIFSRFQLGERDIQSETKPADLTNEDFKFSDLANEDPKIENHKADGLKPSYDSDDQLSDSDFKFASLADEDPKIENHEADGLKPSCDSDDQQSESSPGKLVDIKMHAEYNLKLSPRHDLCLIFTCTVCDTRTMKTASKEAYEKGVVVARCSGCNNLHLMADHLGMFGEKSTVEDFLASRGEEVKKGHSDTLNLTLEDLAGKDLAAKIVDNEASTSAS
ncbi:PREDICTED: uncharacterized protein LOC101291376 [Fragaria vesca subsp. vesca]|uniref:uncharacterized protein LOC101291376 n=1 Tax=Fragaria vesca subsp. vesca TaxID=101020 RepID=UPI0002C3015F|nr:PREDICTED: uncharacterized protein LOC101291376 [Fragaria vesca subsp. vesca]